MHQSFISKVVEEVWTDDQNLENTIFILPSRRACTFLKSSISQKAKRNIFAPKIYSIEQFIELLADLSYASLTEQLFVLYKAYLQIGNDNKESFYDFSKWARTLLSDFDEIDRYLIPHKKIFSYLSAITEVTHWYVQKERTPVMEDYIKFWNSLEPLYNIFSDILLEQGKGHQGLVYRTALQKLPEYLESAIGRKHVFLGFNALNKAESEIIQNILGKGESEIYWDIDQYFLNESYHDAGYFIRRHQKHWKYFQKRPLNGISEDYLSPKNIEIIGVPKNVSQVKYAGSLLDRLSDNNHKQLSSTALILGDESLLNPLLNALPAQLDRANITMGYPLKSTPLAGLFNQFFNLYLHQDSRGWHHKKIMSFLSLPYVQLVLSDQEKEGYLKLRSEVHNKNLIYLSVKTLDSFFTNTYHLFFSEENYDVSGFLTNCLSFIRLLRLKLEETKEHSLELEQLYCIYTLFNQLRGMIEEFPYIQDIPTLQSLFMQLMAQQSIDFQGEPLEGLQIMGMLESRVLDFETVIITSVNEGILPAGKQGNSFIPFDLKKEMGLPTYKEKDAVYTYHFYRLLQRTKNVYLLYNTEPDVLLGGEMSRLLHQLMTDQNTRPYVQHKLATMDIHLNSSAPIVINKGMILMEAIKTLAEKGFSPTSLTQYIRDPVEFYKRAILKIDESSTVDETIVAKNFGTVIHNTLEELLAPFVGRYLNPEELRSQRVKIKEVIKKYFTQFYTESSLERGKNSIAFHVLIRNVENFIDAEIRRSEHHSIKLLALEKEFRLNLDIPEIPFPVHLKGKVDRIDEVDGVLRILDYKTGKVVVSDMNLVSWEELIKDPDLNKVFQVLCYALLYGDQYSPPHMEAGIISFKNLKQGFLSFATKEKKTSKTRYPGIDAQILDMFKDQLHVLIREICNPDTPFIEKVN